MSTERRSIGPRQTPPLGAVCVLLSVLSVALAIGLVLAIRSNGGHQANATDTTVAGLRTELARAQHVAATERTEVASQQQTIERLRKAATAQQTPSSPDNGARRYLASFLIDKYSYVLYFDWVETNGFIHDGRMLTADNYGAGSPKSFQFSGVDNNGSYGFTGTGGSAAMTFTGTRNGDGTLTISGLPWSVFSGFVGGTFSQRLHASSMDEYNTALANLARQNK